MKKERRRKRCCLCKGITRVCSRRSRAWGKSWRNCVPNTKEPSRKSMIWPRSTSNKNLNYSTLLEVKKRQWNSATKWWTFCLRRMNYISCIISRGGTTSEATGPYLYSHSIPRTKRFHSRQSMPSRVSNNLKMRGNLIYKTRTISTMKVNSESKVISNHKKHRSMVMVPETTITKSWVAVPVPPKQASTTCTIIQQMIKIVMRICVEEIKVGWTNVSPRATISATTTYETHRQALAYKYVNKMWQEMVP